METRACRKCRKFHPVFYFVNTKQTHLVMICGASWTYVPYEEGLDVETVYSKTMQAVEARDRELDKQCDDARDRDQTKEPEWLKRFRDTPERVKREA
jgi:hypothetical protein